MTWREEIATLRPRGFRLATLLVRTSYLDAEDVVQEATLKCLVRGYDPTQGARVSTWYFGMILQAHRELWRKRDGRAGSFKNKARVHSIEAMSFDVQDRRDYEELITDGVLLDRLLEEMEASSPLASQVILAKANGQSHKDAAAEAGYSAHWSKIVATRTQAKLVATFCDDPLERRKDGPGG